MDDWPYATGSGAHLRFRSNVQAWLDLNWNVEVIRVGDGSDLPPEWPGVRFTSIPAQTGSHSFLGRVQYRLGWAGRAGLADYFAKHTAICQALAERMQAEPEAWHMLEGDSLANAAPLFPSDRLLFSHHDLSSEALQAIYRSLAELDRRPLSTAEKREIRFMQDAERRICRHSRLVLCISDHDREVLQTRYGIAHAAYLPMSITPEMPVSRPASHGQTELRLLHAGRVSHLPSYRSLEFLFQEVFPRLRPETRARLRMRVAGKSDGDDARSRHVRAMGEPYADIVEWVGFVSDLNPVYAWADLQIVASTEVSGLRTRIVESLARGLPVLSTPRAARGLGGLQGGENILLAGSADDFAETLERLTADPAPLIPLAARGRELYLRMHSRKAVAERLGALLAPLLSAS